MSNDLTASTVHVLDSNNGHMTTCAHNGEGHPPGGTSDWIIQEFHANGETVGG